ncbi:hypothetical protein BGZ70_007828 [Mortierella alpina]|uniref:Uncharacterized protein n=1 Tax=Mortierella alpina TaxID=64518 RepID=A0A9P6J5A0_MORAP|nr:hypothetical protein BGZ70_007828 [Mortierella alpina]
MFKKPEGAPSSSQDPALDDVARVRYTTAELKDALRPTSSSQPTPAAVRGNAARRMALSQQAQSPVALAPAHTNRHRPKHKQSQQRPAQEQGPGQERTHGGLLAPLSTRLGSHSLSQFGDISSSPSPSTSASMSQLSSPSGSQQGDSIKKKYRHRKKKHRPVTSALHGKIGASHTTDSKRTPTTQPATRLSQQSPVTMEADHSDNEDDQKQTKSSADLGSTSAREMVLSKVSKQHVVVEVQTRTHTQTLLQGSKGLVSSQEAETTMSSTRATDSVLSPVQEAYESGEDESDDSPTLPLPELSATLEVINSEEQAMYSEIECGQRIPESQPVTAPELASDASSVSSEEHDPHFDMLEQTRELDFDALEQTQELDFDEFESYPKSQGTHSPPPSASESSPTSPISPASPATPINFKAGSPTLDLGSVSQQSVEGQTPVAASVSKEQSPSSGEESDEQEVWHPSLQSVRSSNGSESPSESEPGPGSMVTLEYDASDDAPITQAFSQRSESPAVTGTLFSLDKDPDTNDRANNDKETLSGVRISTRTSGIQSASTPERNTGVNIPEVIVTRKGRSNGNATDVAANGRRLSKRQHTPEPIVEIEVSSHNVESGLSNSPTDSPTGSQSLAFVNIPTSTRIRNRVVKNHHASLSKDLDDEEYSAPDELDNGNRNSNSDSSEGDSSDGLSSDIAEEEEAEYGRPTRRMTRARLGRTSKRLEKQRDDLTSDSPARRTRSSRQNSERREGVDDDGPSRHTRLADRRSMERHDPAVLDSPSKRTRASMRLRSEHLTSPSPVPQRVLRTRRSTRQVTPTPAPKRAPAAAPRRRILTRGSRTDGKDEDSTPQKPVDGHGSTTGEDSSDSDGSDGTPLLSRKRKRRAPPASSSISASRAQDTRQDGSRVMSSPPSLRAATTPDLEMDQVVEDQLADQPGPEAEMTLQSEESESDDEWDVRRLRRIWKRYNISWPLRDRRAESEAKKKGTFQFVNEPYSIDFIFGTALPLPKSANVKLFGEA